MINRLKAKCIKWILRTIGMLALILIIYCGYNIIHPQSDLNLSSNSSSSTKYFVVDWPATKNRSAITFHIPKEYLHSGTTWQNEHGQITSFAVQFELPGPIPFQKRPWLEKGSAEYEEFMKTWIGRFTVDIKPSLVGGASFREGMRREASKADMKRADISVAGLERYSTLLCFSESDLIRLEVKEFLATKESNDNSETHCRLDRRWAVLVSPPQVDADDAGLAIRCSSTGCKAYFSVAGCGVSMSISHANIENWPLIIEPARLLIKSFIINQVQISINNKFSPNPDLLSGIAIKI